MHLAVPLWALHEPACKRPWTRSRYVGTIKLYDVSPAWKKRCPTASFLFKYTKQGTNNALEGDEVLELTAANYGPEEWWLLLNPVVQ